MAEYDLDAILAEAAANKQRRAVVDADLSEEPVRLVEEEEVRVPVVDAEPPIKEAPPEKEALPEKEVVTEKEMPAVLESVKEPLTEKHIDRTRVVELPDTRRPKQPPKPVTKEPVSIEGQLDWCSLGVDEPEPPPPDEEELQRQLQETRAQKIKEFQLSGMEEEETPTEETVQPETPTLDDYTAPEEAESVRDELDYQRSTAVLSLLLTALLTGVLLVLAAIMQLTGQPPFDAVIYLFANAALLLITMLINHRLVGSGYANLLRGRADTASAAVLPSVPILIHTLAQTVYPAGMYTGGVFTCVAALCLLMGSVGRYLRLKRIADSFRFVAYNGEKTAVTLVSDPTAASTIGRTAVEAGVPRVAYSTPASFLTGFLSHAYEDTALDRQMRRLIPLGMVTAALSCVAYGVWKGDWWLAFSAFCAIVCGAVSLCPLLVGAMLMHRGSRRALRAGALISGSEAVEVFGDIDAVTVEAEQLFPPDTLLLHGIRTFKGTRIDEAIMDAAAVSIAAGGPLTAVFRRIITDRVEILQPVDTLVYEQDMGVSGWVGGRRVLVGNRRLLQNHGVDVPSDAYEARYAVDGRQLVYLSTAGELSAMFVISYLADAESADMLQAFAHSRIDLLIRSCDPNVTEELTCRTLGLDDYHVAVMDTLAARSYLALPREMQERPAVLATDGRLNGLVAALTLCRRLRCEFVVARVMQRVWLLLAIVVGALLLFLTGTVLPPLLMVLCVLLGALVGCLVPLLCG